MFPKLREQALHIRLPNLPEGAVHAVLMDWSPGPYTVSVLAAADGTASIYLSSGGGFIGGGQKYPKIRSAALHAIQLATDLLPHFQVTKTYELPKEGDIFFYVTEKDGERIAKRSEAAIKSGADPLSALGNTMQAIISEYRLTEPQK